MIYNFFKGVSWGSWLSLTAKIAFATREEKKATLQPQLYFCWIPNIDI